VTAQALYLRKDIAVLPAVLTANTIYALRRGVGFDLFITDNTATIAHKVNNTDDPLKSPVLTYTAGALTGITYADGSTKVLTYTAGKLVQVDLLRAGAIYRKILTYANSVLMSVTESLL
jgi:hypothetical protein